MGRGGWRGWVAAVGVMAGCGRSRPEPPPPPVAFVGEAVCASCHAAEAAAWQTSHHQQAMQVANEQTVLGNFADASFTHDGVTSSMFRRGASYVMRTDGPDGALHDYPVAYTFGVAPLQQYLVAFPGGRFQSPEVAWDSRPSAAGGQRWFHLYPGERIDHTDPLHWTGATENWNYMCADCHSTNVRKAWSEASSTYATQFTEVSVSCEACHGPGSQHAASRGRLPIALDERHGVSWLRDATGKPHRSRARTSEREIEMCARCHARRGLMHEDSVHGQSLGDDYRVALLDEDLYYPDGQIKGEVYEYGSFVQSRMYAEGVTCSDCHDPHSGKLRAPGDGTCLQCHDASYATSKHHFHGERSPGCASCHMPATTYMVVDPRRDHSLRVPRPDLTVALGVPNPCNGCHADRSPAWAAETVASWYGHVPSGFQQFAEALSAGERDAPGAEQKLATLVADPNQPAIARASAIALIGPRLSPATLPLVERALDDASPLVRAAAVRALAGLDPAARAARLWRSLDDPVRTVRLAAATAMIGATDAASPTVRSAFERARAELVATYDLAGDRPESHVGLANLYASERDLDRAEAELRRALAIDAAFVPASINLAELYRMRGHEDDAETCLRQALERAPGDSTLRYALGLVLVRTRRMPQALEQLSAAAHDGADDAQRGYVYAIALHDTGDRRGARRELERVLERHPYDRASLSALVTYLRDEGDLRTALRFAEQLETLEPADATVRATTAELRGRLGR